MPNKEQATPRKNAQDGKFKDHWETFQRMYHQNWTTYKEGRMVDHAAATNVYKLS